MFVSIMRQSAEGTNVNAHANRCFLNILTTPICMSIASIVMRTAPTKWL